MMLYKQRMKMLILCSLLSVLTHSSFAQVTPPENQNDRSFFTCKSDSWFAHFLDAFAQWGLLKIDTSIFDGSIFDGLNGSVHYDGEVDTAFLDGLFFRQDKWSFMLSPWWSKEASDLAGGLGYQNQTEIKFFGLYKSACEAFKDRKSLRDIPTTKEKFKKNFKTTDYVVFSNVSGLGVSGTTLVSLGSPVVNLKLEASYFFRGNFQVYFSKLSDQLLNLRIVGKRSHDMLFREALSFLDVFEIFGTTYERDQVRRIINPDPIRLRQEGSLGRAFIVDYVLNLEDRKVEEAYLKLVAPVSLYSQAPRLGNPTENLSDVQKKILIDLEPLDSLYREDVSNPRIKRTMRAAADFEGWYYPIEIGNRILELGWEKRTSSFDIGVRGENHEMQRYILTTFDNYNHFRWLISFSKERERVTTQSVFKEDTEKKQLLPLNIVWTNTTEDKRFSKREYFQLKKKVRWSMPRKYYNQIRWTEWEKDLGNEKNLGLRIRLVLPTDVLRLIPEFSETMISERFDHYLHELGIHASDIYPDSHSQEDLTQSAESKFNENIWQINNYLGLISSSNSLSHHQKLELFKELLNNSLFMRVGFGFILSLIPIQYNQQTGQQLENFFIEFDMSSKTETEKIKKLYQVFGSSDVTKEYNLLTRIKNAIENQDIDIRQEVENRNKPFFSNNLN
jgi:hypothetical protein